MQRFTSTPPVGQCLWCKHLKNIPKRQCTAFPDGVPSSIWQGRASHELPVVGDHGIQFEERSDPIDFRALGGVIDPDRLKEVQDAIAKRHANAS